MTLRQNAASTPGSREKGERMGAGRGGRCITLQGSSQSLYQAAAELLGKDRPSKRSYTRQDPTSSRTPSCSTLGAEWEGHGLSANPKVQQLTAIYQPPPTAGSLGRRSERRNSVATAAAPHTAASSKSQKHLLPLHC